VLDPAELPSANAVMDRLLAGDYATGTAPFHIDSEHAQDPTRLARMDQPQMADHAITDMVRRSRIGEWAAAITGADMVQVWAMQLIHKPPNPAGTANVGWHQDDDYWHTWWKGEVFTCWLALTDVTADAGPVRFVRRSHTWGFLNSGNFFIPDLDASAERAHVPAGETWEEEPAVLPPGTASFHNRLTIHGSGPNTSAGRRRSYAVHLRTDRAEMLEGLRDVYREQLSDPALSPVIFER
jgi:ectoine hydroxylase-related dioxygenase (phytanoyl-CoA dioxygenase family)